MQIAEVLADIFTPLLPLIAKATTSVPGGVAHIITIAIATFLVTKFCLNKAKNIR